MRKSVIDSFSDNCIYRLETLKLKIIDECNLRCRMCNHWRRPCAKVEDLSTGQVLQLLDEAAELSCRQLTVTGGEATLRQDLEVIFHKAKAHNMRILLLTNGVGVSRERVKALVAGGLTKVTVSLDHPVAETHDYIRGVPGAFEKSVAFIRECASLRHANTDLCEVAVAACVLNINVNVLDELAKLVAGLGVDTFNVSALDAHNEDGKALALSAEEEGIYQNEILPRLRSICKQDGLKFRVTEAAGQCGLSGEADIKKMPCYFAWANVTVRTNGDVQPCCHSNDPETVMGNIRQAGLLKVLNSGQAAKVRSLLALRKPNVCRNCYWEHDYNRRVNKMYINKLQCRQLEENKRYGRM